MQRVHLGRETYVGHPSCLFFWALGFLVDEVGAGSSSDPMVAAETTLRFFLGGRLWLALGALSPSISSADASIPLSSYSPPSSFPPLPTFKVTRLLVFTPANPNNSNDLPECVGRWADGPVPPCLGDIAATDAPASGMAVGMFAKLAFPRGTGAARRELSDERAGCPARGAGRARGSSRPVS